MTRRIPLGLLLAASFGAAGCELLPFFTPDPERCTEGTFRYASCGRCGAGYRVEVCGPDRALAPQDETCRDDELDVDGDGFANGQCYAEHPGDDCCGEVLDCDDDDPVRWPGHADFDGDGEDAYSCGGRDCNDDFSERNPSEADKDGDGRDDVRCCPADAEECDCDDDDPDRWTGHADLDGDDRDAAHCGGNDCDDGDPDRWTGHADLDGDGHIATTCGGDDCDDRDPDRWTGHADLDGDGSIAKTCGGDDCDDGCPTCYEDGNGASRRVCGEARDHDCNGLVDELDGCAPEPPFADLLQIGIVETAAARDVFVSGRRAYLATSDGLLEVDVTAPDAPVISGRADTGDSHGVFLLAGDAFVASAAGVYRVDVSRPGRAAITAGPWPTGDSRGVFVAGPSVYVAAYDGLHAVDLRGTPRLVASLASADTTDSQSVLALPEATLVTRSAAAGGLYSVVRTVAFGLMFMFSAPEVSEGRGLFVSGQHAWVAACPDLIVAGAGGAVVPLATYPTGCASDVFVVGHVAYVLGEAGLLVFDVTNPTDPSERRGPFPIESGSAVFVSGCEVYVAAADGLHVFSPDAGCP